MLTNARSVYQSHNHDRRVNAALAQALQVCANRGARMTPTREAVLKLLWHSHQPLGAYQLKEQLSALSGKAIAPPTVYRALEFLIDVGLIHQIPSINAYVGCPFPNSDHSNVFLICDNCNSVAEIADQQINQLFVDRTNKTNFKLRTKIIELFGLCPNCAPVDSDQ